MFKPLEPITIGQKRKSAAVAEQIVALIKTGQLQPGQNLPSERDIAAQMGVSRGVVREALSALQISNMVHIRIGEGTFVCPQPNVDGSASQALSLLEGDESPLELWEARREIETALICLGAERAKEADHQAISELLKQMTKAIETAQEARYLTLNYRFHMLLMQPSRNSILIRIAEDLVQKTNQTLSQNIAQRYVHENAMYSLSKHTHLFTLYRQRELSALREMVHQHFAELQEFFLKE